MFPTKLIKTKYTISANIIFTTPPANTTAIPALLKDPVSSERSSSPIIFTNPPIGIRRNAYLVSFPCLLHIVGPKPIANSNTLILHNFATKK